MTAVLDPSIGWPNGPRPDNPNASKIIFPLTFEAFVVDKHPEGTQQKGTIYIDNLSSLDDLTGLQTVSASAAAPATDPTVIPVAAPTDQTSGLIFTTDRESINAGECATLRWDVTGINGVWLNDQGVPGQSSQQVCPIQTQAYKLRVLKRDGTTEERTITIQVSGAAPPPAQGVAPAAPAPAPSDSSYGTLGVITADTRRPPEGNPDLDLSLLGYQPNGAAAVYKDYGRPDDPLAPQLRGLFADHRQPGFTTAFLNNGWDWGSNSRTPPSSGKYEATVIGVAVTPGESLFTPRSGRSIGNGYVAMVLYADSNQITLKYTPEDSIARGYTVFIEGISVNPPLLAVYQSSNGAVRGSLPALRAGQLLGTASSGEIRLAIRDNATFMDPRSLQDWWR